MNSPSISAMTRFIAYNTRDCLTPIHRKTGHTSTSSSRFPQSDLWMNEARMPIRMAPQFQVGDCVNGYRLMAACCFSTKLCLIGMGFAKINKYPRAKCYGSAWWCRWLTLVYLSISWPNDLGIWYSDCWRRHAVGHRYARTQLRGGSHLGEWLLIFQMTIRVSYVKDVVKMLRSRSPSWSNPKMLKSIHRVSVLRHVSAWHLSRRVCDKNTRKLKRRSNSAG